MARTPRAEDAPLLRGGGRRETSAAHGPAVWLSIGMVVAGLMVLAIGAVPWGRAHVALVNGALYHPDTASKHSEVRRAEKVAPDGTETHARAPSQPEREWEDDRRDPSALGDGDGETDETNERDAVLFVVVVREEEGGACARRAGRAAKIARSVRTTNQIFGAGVITSETDEMRDG